MRSHVVSLGAILLLAAGCVSIKPSVVEPARYLGQHANSSVIYEAGGAAALLPVFDLRIEPMRRMVLINFSGDPLYEAIELQTHTATGGEESSVVLLARRDAVVDVYISPNHVLGEADRQGMEALLSPRTVTIQEAPFTYHLASTGNGLESAVRLRDRDGREVVLEIREGGSSAKLASMLAPVGASSATPEAFPLIYLDEFGLVRRRGTEIRVSVAGEELTPEKLTWLIRPPAYYSRYATRVVLAQWNERREAVLAPLPVPPGTAEITDGNLSYRLR